MLLFFCQRLYGLTIVDKHSLIKLIIKRLFTEQLWLKQKISKIFYTLVVKSLNEIIFVYHLLYPYLTFRRS